MSNPITTVGIVVVGTMGNGIAQACAYAVGASLPCCSAAPLPATRCLRLG